MIMTSRRYSPNASAKLGPAILAVLTDKWVNGAAVCTALGRYTDDGAVRHALRLLTVRDAIDCMSVPSKQSRTGATYLFRRKL